VRWLGLVSLACGCALLWVSFRADELGVGAYGGVGADQLLFGGLGCLLIFGGLLMLLARRSPPPGGGPPRGGPGRSRPLSVEQRGFRH